MSIIESPSGVGARLAGARSEQGLSVEDLSTRTYIRAGVIRGIEGDDFSACGGPFYARGHIRTLARALGLDEASLLEVFDRQHGAPEPRRAAEAVGTSEPLGRTPNRLSRRAAAGTGRSGPPWFALASGILVVLIVVLVIGLIAGGPAKGNRTPTAAATTAPASASATPSPQASAKKPSPAPVASFSGVNLQLTMASGPSWMRVTDENGKVLVAQTQQQGSTVTYRGDSSLRLVLGNAGAVQGTCNGQSLGSLGSRGQVASRTLALTDGTCGKATS